VVVRIDPDADRTIWHLKRALEKERTQHQAAIDLLAKHGLLPGSLNATKSLNTTASEALNETKSESLNATKSGSLNETAIEALNETKSESLNATMSESTYATKGSSLE